MSVKVEDGSLIIGSDSYVSESDLDAYALNVGRTITGNQTELLIRATLYTESLQFLGKKLTGPQRMQWPRRDARLDGFYIATNEIPELLKKLQCEVALSIDKGIDPSADPERMAISTKVGDISESFSDGGFQNITMAPHIYKMANKLIGVHGGGLSFNIGRA